MPERRDYVKELKDLELKRKSLLWEMRRVLDTSYKDESLTLDERWEMFKIMSDNEYDPYIDYMDIDMFERFNCDYDTVSYKFNNFDRSDSIRYNYITAFLINNKVYEYGEIIITYKIIDYLEAYMFMKGDELIFETKKWEEFINEEGEICDRTVSDYLVFGKRDIIHAKEFILKSRSYRIKFEGV